MTDQKPELLPCPFCNAAPEMEPWHGGGVMKRRIGCANDECPAQPSVTGATPGRAIAAWNRRPAPAQGETPYYKLHGTASSYIDTYRVIDAGTLTPGGVRRLAEAALAVVGELRCSQAVSVALQRELSAANARLAEVERDADKVYVPGLFKCAKCKLTLVSKNLYMQSGTVGANTDPHMCMNGCGPMWRVTERDQRIELMAENEKLHLQLIALKGRADAAREGGEK